MSPLDKFVFDYAARKLGADDCVILESRPFLDGSLTHVRYKDTNSNQKSVYAYVYEKSGMRHCALFESIDEFASYFKDKKFSLTQSGLTEMRTFFSSVETVSGIIALSMTAVIIFLLVKDPSAKTPEVLANSISVILGFYFGRASGSKM